MTLLVHTFQNKFFDLGRFTLKMVTSNKFPDPKVVKMAEQNNSAVVPQRTLLGEVNEHITCPLCRGYYIDATTIVECLHSFCRSCIIKHLQVKSYCPVCEMMINSAKPNIKLDKALQDIVYKLVPGLFQKEMERRQHFYASRPGPAASATPEQRGEDTERIIFSPEDVISFSLEYADATDTDSISSKSSDSNEPQPTSAIARRYLQCPAVVNISHLKKFLSMKFDIDSTQFAIDILYKRVPLPDYYTLMDIAYIYNWKRNEPMRFFYQIIDYVAIRNRLFDINRKGSDFHDRKSSPALTEDTNVSSPMPNLNENGSEASSGTDSPMPGDNTNKQLTDHTSKRTDRSGQQSKNNTIDGTNNVKNDDEVEKSQFLNSFELTAKNNSTPPKSSPTKSNISDNSNNTSTKNQASNLDDSLKRKHHMSPFMHEIKKIKIELEKTKLAINTSTVVSNQNENVELTQKFKEMDKATKSLKPSQPMIKVPDTKSASSIVTTGQNSQLNTPKSITSDNIGIKRSISGSQSITSPKRKTSEPASTAIQNVSQKTVSPLKLQVPKLEPTTPSKAADVQKPIIKKIPDLKPTAPTQINPNKIPPINKVRMDLLANNSDPTIDRTKIMSQVKSSLGMQNPAHGSGDPLKSLLFDSCKINIPSSLSITLTDQKLDPRIPGETNTEQKKTIVNKNLAGASNTVNHKAPSPPVHNYIEILKLPDTDPKKQAKSDNSDSKLGTPAKPETTPLPTKTQKSSETSAKGPIPNLKPIDTKLTKQSGNFSPGGSITFQQTFEKQLQSLQSDKKPKTPKNKSQVPKLVPANPKTFGAANKLASPSSKPVSTPSVLLPLMDNKSSAALDLSTPHNLPGHLSPQQSKAFETMQSIANLAKKQTSTPKGMNQSLSHSFTGTSNRPMNSSPLRIPSLGNASQVKHDKLNSSSFSTNTPRQELTNKTNPPKSVTNPNASMSAASPSYQMSPYNSNAHPSPRSQTRSPSSSPKLVIAEDKQVGTPLDQNVNQSNQVTSTQMSSLSTPKSESPKVLPGPSKPTLKSIKSLPTINKITGIRQPITPTGKPNTGSSPADFPMMSAHQAQAILTHQMHQMTAWLSAHSQFDVYKNMSNMTHQSQNDFNKDK